MNKPRLLIASQNLSFVLGAIHDKIILLDKNKHVLNTVLTSVSIAQKWLL